MMAQPEGQRWVWIPRSFPVAGGSVSGQRRADVMIGPVRILFALVGVACVPGPSVFSGWLTVTSLTSPAKPVVVGEALYEVFPLLLGCAAKRLPQHDLGVATLHGLFDFALQCPESSSRASIVKVWRVVIVEASGVNTSPAA